MVKSLSALVKLRFFSTLRLVVVFSSLVCSSLFLSLSFFLLCLSFSVLLFSLLLLLVDCFVSITFSSFAGGGGGGSFSTIGFGLFVEDESSISGPCNRWVGVFFFDALLDLLGPLWVHPGQLHFPRGTLIIVKHKFQ